MFERLDNGGMGVEVLGLLTAAGTVPSPRERALLAVLVVRRAQFVDIECIAEALWPDKVPPTWRKQIQITVSQLRLLLGTGAIRTGPGCYQLELVDDDIDVVRFEEGIAAARRFALLGHHRRAIVAFESAMQLWHGVPYSDLQRWPPALDEAHRLVEVRRSAEEELTQARLDAGQHRSVVVEAGRLVREDPLREIRWAMLATALARSGRQQHALDVLREARTRLQTDLGLDPSPLLKELEQQILRQDLPEAPIEPPADASPLCPYRGLEMFDQESSAEFFGRAAEVSRICDRLGANGMLALVGPSGCGKSSLLRAGVATALANRGVAVTICTPATTDLRQLVALLGRLESSALILDQAEELFQAAVAPDDLELLADAVTAFVARSGLVLLAARSDCLGQLTGLSMLDGRLPDALHFVRPMTADDLRSTIEEPARLAGLTLEPGLVALVVRDMDGKPTALPLLSHALAETWKHREGSVLTVAAYERIGGLAGAVARSAEQLYARLTPEQQLTCRALFERLVSFDSDGGVVRHRATLGPLQAESAYAAVLVSLVAARLVSVDDHTVTISHEALTTAWPRLHGWLSEDAAEAQIARALAIAAENWAAAGRPERDLFTGARLQTALEWRDRTRTALTVPESQFLDASAANDDNQMRQAIDQAREERRRNRRLRGLLTAVVALLVMSVVAGLAAVSSHLVSANHRRLAEAARDDAEFTTLVQRSIALRSSQRDVAALLAAEAYQRRPRDVQARSALLSSLVAARGLLSTRYLPLATWLVGAGSADRATVVLVDSTGHAGLYRAGDLQLLRTLDLGVEGQLDGLPRPLVAYSHAAHVAVVSYRTREPSGQLRSGARLAILDTATGRRRGKTVQLAVTPHQLVLAPHGDVVAVVGERGELATVGLSSGSARLQQPGSAVNAVAYSSDSKIISLSADGELRVGRHLVGRIAGPIDQGSIVVAGSTVVAAGDRTIAAFDLRTSRRLWSWPFDVKQPGQCRYSAASVIAGAVFCGNSFGIIQRRDLRSGLVTDSLDRQRGAVGTLTVSADGSELMATGGSTAAVSRWQIAGGGPASRILAKGHIAADAFDGGSDRTLTAVRRSGIVNWDDFDTFEIWDMRTDRRVGTPIHGHAYGWVAPGIVLGIAAGTGDIEYLNVKTRARYLGAEPLGPDADKATPGPSGQHVYVSYPDGRIDNLDPASGRVVGPQLKVAGFPLSVAATRQEDRLAVAWYSVDGMHLTLFATDTGRPTATRADGPEAVAFAPTGELYGGTETGAVLRYGTADLSQELTVPGARGWINSLQFSADGTTLAVTANDSTVTLIDLPTGQRLGDPIPTQAPFVIPGFLKPDGSELLITVRDGIAAWTLDPAQQYLAVCRIAGRQLTAAERQAYVPGGQPHDGCPANP